AGCTTDQVRSGYQPQYCKGTWPYDPADAARPRRRGDRMKTRTKDESKSVWDDRAHLTGLKMMPVNRAVSLPVLPVLLPKGYPTSVREELAALREFDPTYHCSGVRFGRSAMSAQCPVWLHRSFDHRVGPNRHSRDG